MIGRFSRLGCRLALPGVLLAAASACSPTVTQYGHRLDNARLERIKPGVTSREEVARLLGSPSATGTFESRQWYYISQRTEQRSFYQQDLVAQDVVAITFDERGIVQRIDQRDLQQAQAVTPDPEKTRTLGNELTILEQFVGNVGRFNPDTTPGRRPGQP